MFLLPLIMTLLLIVWNLLLAIVQIVIAFVLALLVGILTIVRAVLPYALRAACITLFVFGWLQGVMSVNVLYTRLTDSVGALFVAAAFGVVLIALPVFGLMPNGNVWSAFALAGLSGFVCAFLCAQAQTSLILEWLARGLPVALAASGLVYIAAKHKKRQRTVIRHDALPDSRSE
jgi:hypothetical protein